MTVRPIGRGSNRRRRHPPEDGRCTGSPTRGGFCVCPGSCCRGRGPRGPADGHGSELGDCSSHRRTGKQHDAVRIMYVHVPSAWLASAGYFGLGDLLVAVAGVAASPGRPGRGGNRPGGRGFTALCLATGSLWGKPMWGAWWVWDARLTFRPRAAVPVSGPYRSGAGIRRPGARYRAEVDSRWLGWINLPIIKFTWGTGGIHCTTRVDHRSWGAPSMDTLCCGLLFISAAGFTLAFAAIVVARLRAAGMEAGSAAQNGAGRVSG